MSNTFFQGGEKVFRGGLATPGYGPGTDWLSLCYSAEVPNLG